MREDGQPRLGRHLGVLAQVPELDVVADLHSPGTGSRSPTSTEMRVDLPEPLWPIRHTCSPASTQTSASSKSRFEPASMVAPSIASTTFPDRCASPNENASDFDAAGVPVRSVALDAVDLLLLRLRPGRQRVLRSESLDEPLQPGDVRLPALRVALEEQLAPRLLDPPLVPRPGEELWAPLAQLEHRVADGLQEPAVVGDQNHRGVHSDQHLLEPFERGDVQVVGRLVEQEEIRLRRKRASKRGARQLTARERREVTVQIGQPNPRPRTVSRASSRQR